MRIENRNAFLFFLSYAIHNRYKGCPKLYSILKLYLQGTKVKASVRFLFTEATLTPNVSNRQGLLTPSNLVRYLRLNCLVTYFRRDCCRALTQVLFVKISVISLMITHKSTYTLYDKQVTECICEYKQEPRQVIIVTEIQGRGRQTDRRTTK